MKSGRKLLFHNKIEVDDGVGTYVTDYILTAVCFLTATALMYRILKQHFSNPDRKKSNCNRFISWHWPGEKVLPITMATYSSVCFLFTYGSVALFGGLSHEYLQQEPQNDSDEIRWLISWRIASGSAVVSLCAILTLCEQLYQQERFLCMPDIGRKIFYILLYLAGIAAITENFIRMSSPKDPYNITILFVAFMGGIMLYGVAMLILVVRHFIIRCQNARLRRTTASDSSIGLTNSTYYSVIRWDLILQCACPCLIVAGGIFSFLLTPVCSKPDAQEKHGCPLPDDFNHNAIMHLIHATAAVCLGMGELWAIKNRTRNANEEMYKQEKNMCSERLV